jgi:hypothetical protein
MLRLTAWLKALVGAPKISQVGIEHHALVANFVRNISIFSQFISDVS